MATDKQTKPHYLEFLNTIAWAEQRAGVFLQVWADKTPNPELSACLSLVAARETSHYDVFKRRIEELGYGLVEENDSDFEERMRLNGSDAPDVEKLRFARAIQERQQSPTLRERYEAAISDETIDPLTRSILRWFADEETDSRERMAGVYARIEA